MPTFAAHPCTASPHRTTNCDCIALLTIWQVAWRLRSAGAVLWVKVRPAASPSTELILSSSRVVARCDSVWPPLLSRCGQRGLDSVCLIATARSTSERPTEHSPLTVDRVRSMPCTTHVAERAELRRVRKWFSRRLGVGRWDREGRQWRKGSHLAGHAVVRSQRQAWSGAGHSCRDTGGFQERHATGFLGSRKEQSETASGGRRPCLLVCRAGESRRLCNH